ncbi:hypothetical protein CLV56_2750 [Mumia flava]|uniref:Uncharacterized protein n=1 Tax=Mumia flava TaxID=1348852 RepID=A0A0B2BI48_9ACTN|nr:hypothetical protein [Mumia flava]PJJ58499.1 hypothetical protein CLV56_2750 [Mumia flava]
MSVLARLTWVIVVAGLAALAAVGAVRLLGVPLPGYEPPPPGDVASAAIETLPEDHLYIVPEMAGVLSDEERAAVSAAAAASDPAVFITIINESSESGWFIPHDLRDQIMVGVDLPGQYLVWDGTTYGTSGTLGGNLGYIDTDLTGKNDAALLRYVDAVDSTTLEPADEFDYWGGLGGGITAGLLMVLCAYPALMLVVGIVRVIAGRSFLLPGRWRTLVTGRSA